MAPDLRNGITFQPLAQVPKSYLTYFFHMPHQIKHQALLILFFYIYLDSTFLSAATILQVTISSLLEYCNIIIAGLSHFILAYVFSLMSEMSLKMHCELVSSVAPWKISNIANAFSGYSLILCHFPYLSGPQTHWFSFFFTNFQAPDCLRVFLHAGSLLDKSVLL